MKEFSLYPNHQKRLLFHLAAWGVMMMICLMFITFLFRTTVIALPTLLYTLFVLTIIVINHYVLVHYGFKLIKGKKWIFFVVLLILLYLQSVVSVMPLELLAGIFPEYGTVKFQSERYYIHSLADLVSLNNFIWVFTLIIFGNLIMFSLKVFKNSYESNIKNALLQKENTELELNFLRAQVHPHFLFNTLNNIYGLVMDNDKAAQTVLKLSDLLRFSLYESNGGFIPLKREVEFLTGYISLEQIRHNDRVNIEYCFENISNREVEIAPLLLITFVENAFKHGINATRHQAWVHICLKQENDTITFTVENSKPANLKSIAKAEGGLGMENVKRRLALQYPGKHRLTVNDSADAYKVTLTLQTNE